MTPRVCAVVLTYKGRPLLETMLPTLVGQRYRDFEVVVVDDGSGDGTVEWLAERWPELRVAASLNRGIDAAGGEYVALLNNDLELDPDWLGELVNALDRHPGAASATGKLLNFHRRGEIDAAGDLMRWSGMSDHRGRAEPDDGRYDAPAAVFSPSAGAALYRRACFEDIGLFDEDFVAYLEDVDWGFRAQLGGYTARYQPSALAYHVGGATTMSDAGRYVALQRRNHLLVVLKSYPAGALVRHAPEVLLLQAGWLLASARDGILGAHLRGLADVVRLLPRMLKKRHTIQRERRVSLAELDAAMTPEIYAGATPGEVLGSLRRILSRSQRGSA
jgi:GT2 family glycosyltransferase